MNEPLRIGTDCSGIEAPIQALIQLDINYHHSFSSEVDKYAVLTFKANYPEPDFRYTDLTSRDHSKLPDIDLYVCGFPCQSFSGLGKKQGLEDPRGNIMFHCISVIKIKQPKFFILENVKGFMTNDSGNTMKVLVKSLEEAGYTVHHKLLNTKDFGLPQNRPRVYFVGIRNDLDIQFEFPREVMAMQTIDSLLVDHTYNPDNIPSKNNRNNLLRSSKGTISPTDHWISTDTGFGNAMNGICPTLTKKSGFFSNKYNRRLTNMECLKLQGFPENFKCVVSNTQLYYQAGNTMSVPILKYIIRTLLASTV
jgi:DNA (cytosine-5)-methyltransferase 1